MGKWVAAFDGDVCNFDKISLMTVIIGTAHRVFSFPSILLHFCVITAFLSPLSNAGVLDRGGRFVAGDVKLLFFLSSPKSHSPSDLRLINRPSAVRSVSRWINEISIIFGDGHWGQRSA